MCNSKKETKRRMRCVLAAFRVRRNGFIVGYTSCFSFLRLSHTFHFFILNRFRFAVVSTKKKHKTKSHHSLAASLRRSLFLSASKLRPNDKMWSWTFDACLLGQQIDINIWPLIYENVHFRLIGRWILPFSGCPNRTNLGRILFSRVHRIYFVPYSFSIWALCSQTIRISRKYVYFIRMNVRITYAQLGEQILIKFRTDLLKTHISFDTKFASLVVVVCIFNFCARLRFSPMPSARTQVTIFSICAVFAPMINSEGIAQYVSIYPHAITLIINFTRKSRLFTDKQQSAIAAHETTNDSDRNNFETLLIDAMFTSCAFRVVYFLSSLCHHFEHTTICCQLNACLIIIENIYFWR